MNAALPKIAHQLPQGLRAPCRIWMIQISFASTENETGRSFGSIALASAAVVRRELLSRLPLRVNSSRGRFTLEDLVADISDNVTLEWLARHLVGFRQETRTRLDGLERHLQRPHDDFDISAAILRRVNHGRLSRGYAYAVRGG